LIWIDGKDWDPLAVPEYCWPVVIDIHFGCKSTRSFPFCMGRNLSQILFWYIIRLKYEYSTHWGGDTRMPQESVKHSCHHKVLKQLQWTDLNDFYLFMKLYISSKIYFEYSKQWKETAIIVRTDNATKSKRENILAPT
jgi:hypothetical protein